MQFARLNRRAFAGLIGAAASWPLAARAQSIERARRVGFLSAFVEDDAEAARRLAAFMARLQELGWTDARNLRVDVRFGYNNDERIRQAATELIRGAPDAIVSTTSVTTRALMTATATIPIVAAITGDPIDLGWTKNLSRPTGNITGFTTFNDAMAAKQLEILRQIVPTMRSAALMWVAANPQQVLLAAQTRKAAQALGIELLSLPINAADEISPALAMAHNQQASGVIVAAEPLTISNGRAIIERCLSLKLPAVHTYAFEARNGALMSYGVDIADNYRRTAEYIDRILKGTRIADLPFQHPTRFMLSINLQTARAIGVEVPSTLLALADEVIES
jgi:putative tryptophan/tyrosine transport system substrate-binding protein